jgi:hypothetical protein
MERDCDIFGLGSSQMTNFGIVCIEASDSATVVLFLLRIDEVTTESSYLSRNFMA